MRSPHTKIKERTMKHIKRVSASAPVQASILNWYGQAKAQLGAYITNLFFQADGRTSDAHDGDQGIF